MKKDVFYSKTSFYKRACCYAFVLAFLIVLIGLIRSETAVSQILPPPVSDLEEKTIVPEKKDGQKKSGTSQNKPVKTAPPGNHLEETPPDDLEVSWKRRFKSDTGSLPKGVVLTPDEKEAWVTNFGFKGRRNLCVFDAATGKKKKEIHFPGRAVEIAFSPDGKTAYVSNFDTGRLMLIDTKTYTLTKSIKVGTNPKIVTLSPSGDDIYVSNWSSNTISIIDAKTNKVINTVRVGLNPRGSDTDSSGRYLFVANFNGHTMSVVDIKKGKQIKVLKMRAYPRHVTTTPDGKYVLCSNMGQASNQVAVIDPLKKEVIKWIKVGGGPKVISVSPDSRFAFTANYYDNSVSVIDIVKLERTKDIKNLGKSCCGMDLTKDGKILYVTSWHSNDLWAFDIEYKSKQKQEDMKKPDMTQAEQVSDK